MKTLPLTLVAALLLAPAAKADFNSFIQNAAESVSSAAESVSGAANTLQDAASSLQDLISGNSTPKSPRPATADEPAAATDEPAAAASADADEPAASADADEPAVAASGSFSFGKPKAEDPANLVTIEAKGQGESVEAAKKDAVRNAIKMVVGELVDAKTLVENDELVQDKILTLSNAVVEKADYGDAKSVGDGLFEVPVTAVVMKGRLNKELEKIGIATGAVAGDSLAASLFSGKERVANAEKFFAERLVDFPGNLVEGVMLAKKDGTPDIEIDDDTGEVSANVGLRVNMANYTEWTKQLKELLGAVCLEQESVILKFDGDQRSDEMTSNEIKVRLFPKKKVFGSTKREDVGDPVAISVVVATPAAEKVRRGSWPATVYYLDAQMWKAFAKQLAARYPVSGSIRVALKDEDDEPVCSSEVEIPTYRYIGRPDWYGTLGEGYGKPAGVPLFSKADSQYPYGSKFEEKAFIAPAFGLRAFGSGQPSLKLYRNKELTLKFRVNLGKVEVDDLGAVSGFEVKVEFRHADASGDGEG